LLISRTFAGACGGNITVAQAYIADITPRENRSKRMGLIGMAFGLGFICGPIIGGLGLKYLGFTGPGWLAAGICVANFLLALFILKESRTASSEPAKPRPHLKQWGHTLSQPNIGMLVLIFFLATFAFSCFEITLPLLINDDFHLDLGLEELRHATTITSLFVYCGLIGAFVQGGATGRLVKIETEISQGPSIRSLLRASASATYSNRPLGDSAMPRGRAFQRATVSNSPLVLM